MSLCRLLFRSTRRYSSSNPYPSRSPFPAPATQSHDYPPQNSQYNNPTHPAVDPPNPNTSNPNKFYSPVSSVNAAADASNNHYNAHIPSATRESSNYSRNPQSSAAASTATNGSNYQYNTQRPAATGASYPQHNPQNTQPDSSNFYRNPQLSAASSSNGSNYQYNPQTPAATDASNPQHNPQNTSQGSSNYYRNPQLSAAASSIESNYQYNPQISVATDASNIHHPQNTSTGSSNFYRNPQSFAASSNGSNYQYNPQTLAVSDALNPQHNPQNTPQGSSNYYPNHFSDVSNDQQNPPILPQGSSNYYQNHHSSAVNTSSNQYNPQTPANESMSPNDSQFSTNFQFPNSISDGSASSIPYSSQRSSGFNSAEEAAAERRRRKRILRIQPPLYALRPNPPTASPNHDDPNKPKLPDSTNALVGPRLNLHNRVQSLIRAGDLDSASYVARQSVLQYVRPTVFTCNAIIAAMHRAKRYEDSKALFQYFIRQFNIIPNVVSYNTLIVSHCESNEVDEALKVYEYILENATFSPSAVTYRHLTKGLVDSGRIDEAVSLLHEMLQKGQGADSLVYNNLILGFLNLGNFDKADELFNDLKERCTYYDGVINATFMDWFFKQGKSKEAMESYRDLLSKGYRMVPATRNVLLETLLKHGKKKEAWDLFHDMLDDHTPPTFQAVNSDTVNMMVNECFKEGNVEEAIDVFTRSGKGVKSKPFQMDVAGFNNMIARLCELEMMEEAEKYYQQLCDKSLSHSVDTYKILIDAYTKLDRVDDVLTKYLKMVEVGLRVIPPYANKWFVFLTEKGRAYDCLPILRKMADREPKPDATSYEIVTRGLIEEGKLDDALVLLREMTNHGVGTTVSLKEFVLGVFDRLGRVAEIEDILNSGQSHFSPRRPYAGTRAPPSVEQGGRNSTMPWQGTSTNEHARQPQMTGQVAHQHSESEQEAAISGVAM